MSPQLVVVHEAGEPVPHVQRCRRCGVVLIDRTGEMRLAVDTTPLRWWEGNVAVAADGSGSWRTTQPASCTPRAQQ